MILLLDTHVLLWWLADDPRLTHVGRLLRRLSLDELPNLVNVLSGHMALVGPRPTLEAQVDLYTPRQRRRLEVRPGITAVESVGSSRLARTSSSSARAPRISARKSVLLTPSVALRPGGGSTSGEGRLQLREVRMHGRG